MELGGPDGEEICYLSGALEALPMAQTELPEILALAKLAPIGELDRLEFL